MREDIKFEPFDQVKHEAGFQAIADEVDARVLERIVNMNLDAEYKKYVEHWGDPIDPINYKLYSIETNMPCFHPDNRLFTKEEFREQLEKVSPQDIPAIDITTNPEGTDVWKELYDRYKATEEDRKELEEYNRMLHEGNKQYFHKDKEIGDIDYMYKWIREKSGK
jgi:hypothetical protein